MIIANTFPRQVMQKRKLVFNKKEFYDYIKQYNGRKNIYYSIYPCNQERSFENTTIDKIFFDFDGKRAYDDTKKLITHCMKTNLKFCVLFSGMKGFHVYIFTKKFKGKHLLKNAHVYFNQTLKIQNDVHIMGDTARISRVPNSYHIKGKRYCISLSLEEFEYGLKYIKDLAKQPKKKMMFYGNKLLNIKTIPVTIEKDTINIKSFDYKKIVKKAEVEKLLRGFPPCVLSWLMDYDMATHQNRFFFALACAHYGLSKEECNTLAKKYYSKQKEKNGYHTRYFEFVNEKNIENAFSKLIRVPPCDKLITRKACRGKCKLYSRQIHPIYK